MPYGVRLRARQQAMLPATATPGVPSTTARDIIQVELNAGSYELSTDGVVMVDTKTPDVGAFTIGWLDEPQLIDWPGGSIFFANLTGSVCVVTILPATQDIEERDRERGGSLGGSSRR